MTRYYFPTAFYEKAKNLLPYMYLGTKESLETNVGIGNALWELYEKEMQPDEFEKFEEYCIYILQWMQKEAKTSFIQFRPETENDL